ncbi:helix-turn-helix domain-containing protein [Solibacillus sp. CAU 1738]|uniref:winged helix-turn-helix transcriptional regulator n=1 Tax=Solibacillus sp. CAU 1738 TaxID=3140363 RepID=UPI00325FF67B
MLILNEQQLDDRVYNKIEVAYSIIGKKWMCLIINSLMDVPKRFSEINSIIPELSKRMLTERLKELEDYDIILRNVITDRPLRSEYSLTNKGEDLGVALQTVESWAKKWL